MNITFVGGPWHGTSRSYDPPLPARISAEPAAVYVPWCRHPATAGVLAPALEHAPTYVLGSLMPPALLERVQDVLLHCPAVGGAAQEARPRCGLAV